jgi:hypothetical protein
MQRAVRLNRIDTVLSELSYPTTPAAVAVECSEVTVELADGTVSLGETVRASHAERFDSPADLELEFMGLLPRHAVGEPYQSEGDA